MRALLHKINKRKNNRNRSLQQAIFVSFSFYYCFNASLHFSIFLEIHLSCVYCRFSLFIANSKIFNALYCSSSLIWCVIANCKRTGAKYFTMEIKTKCMRRRWKSFLFAITCISTEPNRTEHSNSELRGEQNSHDLPWFAWLQQGTTKKICNIHLPIQRISSGFDSFCVAISQINQIDALHETHLCIYMLLI